MMISLTVVIIDHNTSVISILQNALPKENFNTDFNVSMLYSPF